MISDARWAIAQQCERDWWRAADRTGQVSQSAPWYAELLGIARASINGRSVLDLGGGPFPIGLVLDLPLAQLTIVDPLATLMSSVTLPDVVRVAMPAEEYAGPTCDEVWGYNVLQHVIDPAAVLNTAKYHARRVIRWFDWVDTAIYPVHPHTISAQWLINQFPHEDWRITSEILGSVMVPHEQFYIAIVAERA